MPLDPFTAYIIAQICVGGLKLAAKSKGLKRLFKRIATWLQTRLLRVRVKLREYVAMINCNPNREITKLADRIRIDSKTRQLAQKYAKKVCEREGVTSFEDFPRASRRNRISVSGYDTDGEGYWGPDADSDCSYSDDDYDSDNYEDCDPNDCGYRVRTVTVSSRYRTGY
ncbi:hypothetical protein AA313_de0200558 [Arthrobotrys entomopaga]|nr:hypothetical protein AA313_de0200558 [Arthrobotrys entomopaga]